MSARSIIPTLYIPAHAYDIIEEPVADDKISRHITLYVNRKISRKVFLESLVHSEPTHQICFCTADSLLMLEYKPQIDINFSIESISELLVEQLMLDLQIDEMEAPDIFYSSATSTQLADTDAKLYLKSWQEIYEMLKKELDK
ncbi:MAG: DUF3990 domain-containing protein [Prevotella sp.]|jgi:hypothetical protein|nr:DUF3990 domain-containing protein [Prevotella sp.]